MIAVKPQHVDFVNVLAEDEQGWAPLHFASDGGHVEIVELLIRKFNA